MSSEHPRAALVASQAIAVSQIDAPRIETAVAGAVKALRSFDDLCLMNTEPSNFLRDRLAALPKD